MKYKFLFTSFFIIVALFATSYAYADTGLGGGGLGTGAFGATGDTKVDTFIGNPDTDTNTGNPDVDTSTGNPDTTDSGTAFDVNLINPIKSDVDTLPELVAEIIRILVLIAIPVITLAIIYAGFLFVAAQGNSEKLGEARKTLIGVLIGAAIVLGAYVLAEAIGSTVTELGNGASGDAGGVPAADADATFGVE